MEGYSSNLEWSIQRMVVTPRLTAATRGVSLRAA